MHGNCLDSQFIAGGFGKMFEPIAQPATKAQREGSVPLMLPIHFFQVALACSADSTVFCQILCSTPFAILLRFCLVFFSERVTLIVRNACTLLRSQIISSLRSCSQKG